MQSTSLSIVIPVYNSELSLPPLLETLAAALPELAGQYEVILVEDNSRDRSWEVIKELLPQYPFLRAFKLMRNYGQHSALLCGIRAVRYEIVITMDDDLQHPPSEIHTLLDKLAEGYDVVYGAPLAEQHGLLRNLASQATKLALQGAMGAETARNASAFRAFRTEVRKAFEDYRGPYANIDVLLTWGTANFAAVRVRHDPRTLGQSNYTLRRLIAHAINMITGFTTIPLRVASLLGLFMTLFGALLMVFLLFNRFILGNDLPGFTFLASIVALFSGTQLFALGIMGEYLSRMHFRMMDRPIYTVREEVGMPEAQQDPD